MCDVSVGEDAFGIWCAGALRPAVTEPQLREFLALAPSGDWRAIAAFPEPELIAVAEVVAPGFPVLALAASGSPGTLAGLYDYAKPTAYLRDGELYSLVAVGRCYDDPGADAWQRLDKRLGAIEQNFELLRPLLLRELDAKLAHRTPMSREPPLTSRNLWAMLSKRKTAMVPTATMSDRT